MFGKKYTMTLCDRPENTGALCAELVKYFGDKNMAIEFVGRKSPVTFRIGDKLYKVTEINTGTRFGLRWAYICEKVG
ncbi:MAG: DUF4318 domain-containing protein [Oscillospiraceae bacterium]